MSMQYTKMPNDAFEKLQLNAGILVDSFNPATATIGNILGATTGGITFASNPTYSDFGEDVDNCPNNTKELKRLESFDPTMSGTFLTCTPEVIKTLAAAADIGVTDTTKVIPRSELISSDFTEVWWIGDYSDKNSGTNAGFIAIHLVNALNQSGFQITSGKNAKGQMAFEYHGHYTISDMDQVPYEIYCKAGTGGGTPADYYVSLNQHAISLADEETYTLRAATNPDGETVTWTSGSSSVATVAAGVVTAEGTGSTIITASITVEGVTYSDTCTVIVTE